MTSAASGGLGASAGLTQRPPVALVHDYLTQLGGAERVVMSMVRAFPGAPLHTSLYDPERSFPALREADVRPLAVNAMPGLRHHHRLALPVLAPAFSMAQVDADVTLISSSGWAHGTRVTGRKIVYCYAPARWLYQRDRYLGGRKGVGWVALGILGPPLTWWDRRSAHSADRYMCVSTVTQQRIRECYGIDAEVIHPPPAIDAGGPQTAAPGLEPGFLLCVSRLLPYKNVDVVITAARSLPERQLVVVGDGPERTRLREMAPPNVAFTGVVDDARLRWLYANCAGLVAASYEDYGLTVLEAATFGKPVAALRDGGYLDTVVEGSSGVFFDDPEPDQVADAIVRLADQPWMHEWIQAWAAAFDEAAFIRRLQAVVREESAIG